MASGLCRCVKWPSARQEGPSDVPSGWKWVRAARLTLALPLIAGSLALGATASASLATGYLNISRESETFIELMVSPDGSVAGTAYTDTVVGANPNARLDSSTASVSGTDDRGDLTLYGFSFSQTTFGALSGSTLSLQLPENAQLVTVTYYRSSVAAFNQGIADWEARIAQANRAAATAQTAAAARAAHQGQLLAQLQRAIGPVHSDLSALRGISEGNRQGDFLGDESLLGTDLSQIAQRLSFLPGDITQAAQNAGFGDGAACGFVEAGYNDAQIFLYQSGEGMLQDAKSGVGRDISAAWKVMARMPNDYTTYWNAQHALPTYHPSPPIPPLKVALASGQSAINTAVAQVNLDIKQANLDVAQGYSTINAGQTKYHCGATKSAPLIGYVTVQDLAG
jgi:hypothetical protein